MTYRKKLIEVALPLEKIKREGSKPETENPFLQGTSAWGTIHLWWARTPLSVCQGNALFASNC